MQSTLDGEAAEVRRQFDAAPKLVFEAADAEEARRGALDGPARKLERIPFSLHRIRSS
jgi:hypothetical protein